MDDVKYQGAAHKTIYPKAETIIEIERLRCQFQSNDVNVLEEGWDSILLSVTHERSMKLLVEIASMENQIEALQICSCIIGKILNAKISPVDEDRVIAESVIFNIVNQIKSLKLLCPEFELTFDVNKAGADRYKAIVLTIVGYWKSDRMELRDLSRACLSCLLLGDALLSRV